MAHLPSLPPESERSSEGGSGKEIGDSTLLDATHQYGVSSGRSSREQLAGGRGRRKLDRSVDWALSSRCENSSPRPECRRGCQLSDRDGRGLCLVSEKCSRCEGVGSGNQKYRGVAEVSPGATSISRRRTADVEEACSQATAAILTQGKTMRGDTIRSIKSKREYTLESTAEDGLYEPVDTSLLPVTRVDAANLIRALQQLEVIAKRQAPRIAFKAKGRILFLDLAEIVAVQAEGNYVSLQHRPIPICCASLFRPWRRSSSPTVLFASTARWS
jgi:hypothetical protein